MAHRVWALAALSLGAVGCINPISDIRAVTMESDALVLRDVAVAAHVPEDFCTLRLTGNNLDFTHTKTYDDAGRPVRLEVTSGLRDDRTDVVWTYVDLGEGRVESTEARTRNGEIDHTAETIVRVHDAMERVESERHDRGSDGSFELETVWSYEDNFTRTERTDRSGLTVTTERTDDFGNVIERIVDQSNGLVITQTSVYSDDGERILEQMRDGAALTWTYNEAGFEASFELRDFSGNFGSRSRTWTFDERGFPTSVLDLGTATDVIHRDAQLVYDDAGRLVSEDGIRRVSRFETVAEIEARRLFSYDAGDRIVEEFIETGDGSSTTTVAWTEDGALLDFDVVFGDGSPLRADTLRYDAIGRMLSHEQFTEGNSFRRETWDYGCR